jgi:hypothetical protein
MCHTMKDNIIAFPRRREANRRKAELEPLYVPLRIGPRSHQVEVRGISTEEQHAPGSQSASRVVPIRPDRASQRSTKTR